MTLTAFQNTIENPRSKVTLYPVVQMITGTTPHGGGTWRHILHASEHGLLRHDRPLMVQALHFKDYTSVTPPQLMKWRQQHLRDHYKTANGLRAAGPYEVDYKGEIFFDSGGFVFMFGAPQGLEKFGLHGDNLQRELIQMKLDLGATKLASLDYPIPPGLKRAEAKERLDRTKANALIAARLLDEQGKTQILVLPVHGSTAKEAGEFTADLVQAITDEGLMHVVAGLGLGSMVPLRRNHRTPEIVSYVQQVHQAAPELALHVFGVTGLLTPFLLHAGATSFDSSNYIQKARVLKYVLPTYRETNLRKLEEQYPCDCRVCASRDLKADQFVIAAEKGEVAKGEKSKVYAALALHNLEQDYRILGRALTRQADGSLHEYMQELSYEYPRMRQLLVGKMPKPARRRSLAKNDENAYDVSQTRYKANKDILLLLPCASEKPYTSSRSFKQVWNVLLDELGAGVERIEVVFVSGLYGPVPISHVQRPPIMQYDFLLSTSDEASLQRVNIRLSAFLNKHTNFKARLAYLAPPAYRKAVDDLDLELYPEDNSSRFSHYRNQNLKALAARIRTLLGQPEPLLRAVDGASDLSLDLSLPIAVLPRSPLVSASATD